MKIVLVLILFGATAHATDVHFSPHGGCTDECVKQINAATKSVHVQAYAFTSGPIIAALSAAKTRGVDVVVVCDKREFKIAPFPVYLDGQHAIAHNKIIIVDGKILLTGSFNFSANAENNNAENLLTIDDKPLIQTYEANFQVHLKHSVLK